MICEPCKRAGDENAVGRAMEHECQYPDTCTCQHRNGRWHVIEEEK